MLDLIKSGALGQKSGAGVYKRLGKEILVFDRRTQDYVPSGTPADAGVQAILKLKDPAEKFAKLRQSDHPQAQFVWAIFRDVFHYCAYHLGSIADNARDLDLAIRWGFGWNEGPFEIWQSAGWQPTAHAIKMDIDAGKTMATAPLPAWVFDGRTGVHAPEGSYSAATKKYRARPALPVYRRQYAPEPILGEAPPQGNTVFESDAVRFWTAPGTDDVSVLSFKSKLGTLGQGVLDGVKEAVARAEKDYKGLVIWQPKPPFSAGADLSAAIALMEAGDFTKLDGFVAEVQQMTRLLKYALVPTVAAVDGWHLAAAARS